MKALRAKLFLREMPNSQFIQEKSWGVVFDQLTVLDHIQHVQHPKLLFIFSSFLSLCISVCVSVSVSVSLSLWVVVVLAWARAHARACVCMCVVFSCFFFVLFYIYIID